MPRVASACRLRTRVLLHATVLPPFDLCRLSLMSAIETLVERALTKATKDSAVHGVDKDQYLLCFSESR